MKLASLCVLLLFLKTTTDISSVRKHYVEAAVSQSSASSFHESFNEVPNDHANNTLLAYKAASIVLMAKYESGIFSKMKYFNRGTALLESVIKKAPGNYEARLIRLNIQDNVPWITGYTGKIKEDKRFLIRYYSSQSADLKEFTATYIKQSEAFTDKEKELFR